MRVRVFAMRAAAYELDDRAGETDPFGRSLSDPEPPPPLASPPESEPSSVSVSHTESKPGAVSAAVGATGKTAASAATEPT